MSSSIFGQLSGDEEVFNLIIYMENFIIFNDAVGVWRHMRPFKTGRHDDLFG